MKHSSSLARVRGHSRQTKYRRGLHRKGSLLAVLTAGMVLAAPLSAVALEPLPAVVVTGFGPGQEVQGLHPGEAAVPNPLDEYPAENPADYVNMDTYAGIVQTASVDDPEQVALMYCINVYLDTEVGLDYVLDTWAESNVPNIGYVTYVLNNYYPNTGLPAGLDEDQQAAAVQAAIWYFTDGFVLDTSEEEIRAAAAAIVLDAQTNGPAVTPGVPGIEITPETASAFLGSRAGPFTVNGQNVGPITVTAPEGSSLHTDAVGGQEIASGSAVEPGTALWVQNNTGVAADGSLSAAASVTLETGSVYLGAGNPADAQPLILAATSQANATDFATFVHTEVDPGTLVVSKAITGAGAGNQSDIIVSVDCGAELNESFIIAAGTPAGTYVQTFEEIADGTSCTVSEVSSGSNEIVNVVAGESATVDIVTGQTSVAELVNDVQFLYGQLSVVKHFAGDGAGFQDQVVLSVVCDGEVADSIVIPAGNTDIVTRTYDQIPAGSTCFIREEESGQNTEVLVSVDLPDPVLVTGGQNTTLEAVNTYTERGRATLPRTGANAVSQELALMGGGILLVGTLMVLGSRRRRHPQ